VYFEYAPSSSKCRAALKKQTAGRSAKSNGELGQKIKVHSTVKKFVKKSPPQRQKIRK
jgi:hypothetical protein